MVFQLLVLVSVDIIDAHDGLTVLQKFSRHSRRDEACSTGNQNCAHLMSFDVFMKTPGVLGYQFGCNSLGT